ncbi:tetratricopeptide repeat protein [Marinobacter confluentis]|uniref:Tetratricopeptide repeat protein n=1 Tax=Marinobacter confluentis TaxID=1697557 RepID=A0A4Z1CJA5_9GAMM|nr:tetratricopeptide repeat protein [Marinobacter confluentis]TGN41532.1 tetratricopeptide repeat protein [Marinobacter confluentis]
MKSASALKTTLIAITFALLVAGCGESNEMSQEEIQYLSHLDQSRFFQRQGELKASTLEARSAIEMQPGRVEPYLVIINNLLTAGDARNAERQLDALMDQIEPANISQPSLNDAALVRAEANLMQQQYQDALDALDTIKDADRAQQSEAALLKGHIQLASGKTEAARQAYQLAQEVTPNSVEPLIGLSKVAYSEDNPEDVARFIQQANEIDPQHVELWLWKARLAHSNERWAEAEQAYINALETIGQYDVMTFRKFETMSALVDVLRQQGKASEAFVYEEILAKSAPGTIRSNLVAAQEAFNENDLTTAARYLEETLAQAPTHEQAALMLGIIRYRQGRPQEAEALLEPIAALKESEQAQKLLAATRLQMRNPDGAKEVLAGLEAQDTDPETMALVGIASLVSGDKESGEQMIQRSLELAPENSSLRLRYAAYLIQEGDTERAIEQAEQALQNDPTLDQARMIVIQAKVSADNLPAARQTAEQWLEQQPDNIGAMIALGNISARGGNTEQARSFFQQAAKAEPENATPVISLGNLALSEQQPDEAKTSFTRAIRLQPDNQQALRGLTAVMEREELTALMEDVQKENPEAIGPRLVLLESALIAGDETTANELTAGLLEREDENSPAPAENLVATVYHGIATQLAQRDRTDEANDILTRGRVLFPEHEQIGLQAAVLAFAEGDSKKAREILSDVKQSHPDSPAPFFVEARYFEQQQEFQQAADLYQLALAKRSSPDLEVSYAQALNRDGQQAKALESLTAAQQRFPNSEPLLTNLAIMQQQTDNAGAAAETYAQLIKVSPNNVIALNNLAWLYHESGDERAIELASRAYELSPNNAAIADTYGWILFKAGETEESLPILEKAHELQPDSQEIAMHLAEAYQSVGRDDDAKQILQNVSDGSS